MQIRVLTIIVALACGPAAAQGNVLYKSVDAKGVITFSDVPPPATSRILEERALPSIGKGSVQASLHPPPEHPPGPTFFDGDAALAKANARLDEAERALAEARRHAGSPLEAMRMQHTRLTPDVDARLEREKANVKVARQALLELMRERLAASVRVAQARAEDGSPIYGELRPLGSRPAQLASR
ncbi:MAG TPA: DUF4124 domain-containing protein [Usitatibacter sp.]|nr:DUF4124 domain-containing protein [Usitatibacter sp.]